MKISIVYVDVQGEDEQVAEVMKGLGEIAKAMLGLMRLFEDDTNKHAKKKDEKSKEATNEYLEFPDIPDLKKKKVKQ